MSSLFEQSFPRTQPLNVRQMNHTRSLGPAAEAAAILYFFYFQSVQDRRIHVRNTGERTLGMSSVVKGGTQGLSDRACARARLRILLCQAYFPRAHFARLETLTFSKEFRFPIWRPNFQLCILHTRAHHGFREEVHRYHHYAARYRRPHVSFQLVLACALIFLPCGS